MPLQWASKGSEMIYMYNYGALANLLTCLPVWLPQAIGEDGCVQGHIIQEWKQSPIYGCVYIYTLILTSDRMEWCIPSDVRLKWKHFPNNKLFGLLNKTYASYKNKTIFNEFGSFCLIIITQFYKLTNTVNTWTIEIVWLWCGNKSKIMAYSFIFIGCIVFIT